MSNTINQSMRVMVGDLRAVPSVGRRPKRHRSGRYAGRPRQRDLGHYWVGRGSYAQGVGIIRAELEATR